MYNIPQSKTPGKPSLKVLGCGAVGVFLLLLMARSCAISRHSPLLDAHDDGRNDIRMKARELAFDPDRCVAFVRESVRLDSYSGFLRGPTATLWAASGSDADRAWLCQALLQECGVPVVLTGGSAWGVKGEVKRGKPISVAFGAGGGAAGAPAAWPGGADIHRIRFRLGSGTDGIESEWAVADLLYGRPDAPAKEGPGTFQSGQVVLSCDAAGETIGFARVLADGSRAPYGNRLKVAGRERLDLTIQTSSKTGPAVSRTREIFTREFAGSPARFHAENVTSIFVTAGWVPEYARARQIADTRNWKDRVAALHRRVAFSFLARSDEYALKLAAGLGVTATFDAPRVTIVSSERDDDRVVVSLDLRMNGHRVDAAADARFAFNSARSLYDGALESQALAEATGAAATSAHDLFANAFSGEGATLAERTGRLESALGRLLAEGPAGSSLVISTQAGRPGVSVTKSADGLHAGSIRIPDSSAVPQGALEIAALLSGLPSDAMTLRYFDNVPDRWYKNARLFYLYGAESRLEFEKQYTAFEPALEISSTDYYDELTDKWLDKPNRGTSYVAHEDLENADTFTTWHMHHTPDPCGYTCDMISRKAYRELMKNGSAVLNVIGTKDERLAPMRFFVVRRFTITLSVNGTPGEFKVFEITGAYESTKPKAPGKARYLPDLKDAAGLSVNYHIVLDDPDYPFFVPSNGFVQTSVTGRVTDAETGQGIDRATVTIVQPGSSAASWPGGSVNIPLFRLPFAEFDVRVEADGYEPLATRIDFRDTTVFPLKLALKPLNHEDPFAFVTKETIGTLGGLALEDHSKALIRAAIAERPGLVAVVPRFAVAGDAGPVDAWLEVDPATGEIYGRLQDGLYGASSGAGWNVSNVQKPFQAQRKAITYFYGRIASWYLFAAGALDSVQKVIDKPKLTTKDMHRNAIRAAREMAKMYDAWVLKVPGNPVTDPSFLKGLKDGLDWAEKFYGEAWKP
ncbi:MAG: carboxypeptidase-like regulatory domain-containing protein [Planctomycetes bacterium]|nr:carboxypeptidase-like regulatory domain-containing protein [Planctomycetota bacterium]